jgi:hypothetical protein
MDARVTHTVEVVLRDGRAGFSEPGPEEWPEEWHEDRRPG